MSPARQWQQIQAGLPEDWSDARLSLRLGDENAARRAAALLTPLQPTRSGLELRFYVARRGAGAAPSALERGLARLDEERIGAELELLAAAEGVTATTVTTAGTRKTLVEEWDEALADLPGDWSDLYAEIELTSSDYLEPAAIALAPLNPARFGGTPGFRFRCARLFGYGASPQMVRRCLTRLAERGIPGELRILRTLADTRPVATQGPVWYVGGKVV
ncbi:MAG TPA: hypothetical protein VFA24_04215 [Gaiellaceae bacterium]|nr:hypothetical protein [Gaiellaceae bacterium]